MRWCAESGRPVHEDVVRHALGPLGWDALLAVKAILADPPPGRDLSPSDLLALSRGAPPPSAGAPRAPEAPKAWSARDPAPSPGPGSEDPEGARPGRAGHPRARHCALDRPPLPGIRARDPRPDGPTPRRQPHRDRRRTLGGMVRRGGSPDLRRSRPPPGPPRARTRLRRAGARPPSPRLPQARRRLPPGGARAGRHARRPPRRRDPPRPGRTGRGRSARPAAASWIEREPSPTVHAWSTRRRRRSSTSGCSLASRRTSGSGFPSSCAPSPSAAAVPPRPTWGAAFPSPGRRSTGSPPGSRCPCAPPRRNARSAARGVAVPASLPAAGPRPGAPLGESGSARPGRPGLPVL